MPFTNVFFVQTLTNAVLLLLYVTLSSAEAPAGYPHQNINNRKNRKRAGDDGNRETCPERSLFLSPQPPHNTKRPLRRGECM